MYFGANDGALHAVRTGSGNIRYGGTIGQEIWAFVPPFIAAKLPTIVTVSYTHLTLPTKA